MDFLIDQISGLRNLACLAAIFLFLNARSLVRSVLIFYTTGVLAGILASFLLFGFFLQRLIPKSTRLPFLFGGWPLSAYIYYFTWQNIGTILRDYQFYAIIYVALFTLISLAVCYRMGPPEDERSLNLVEWTLQLLAMVLIYFVIQNQQIAITLISSLVCFTLWKRYSPKIRRICRRIYAGIREFLFGPQPRRLLTKQEYLDESCIYTRMELDKLRQFCHTQDSKKNWRLISRMHTPNKMASFITGDCDHVSAVEASYHSSCYPPHYGHGEEDSSDIEDQEEDGYITDDE